MVYLIHFHSKLHHSQHYIGYTNDKEGAMEARIKKHRNGSGARILRRCNELGIEYDLVRLWPGCDGKFERKLKNRKNAPKLCPLCKKN
jgi:predicted GIY-YIG superfamily endonuclease